MPTVIDPAVKEKNRNAMVGNIWAALKLPVSVGQEAVTELTQSQIGAGTIYAVYDFGESLPTVMKTVEDLVVATYAKNSQIGKIHMSYRVNGTDLVITVNWQSM